MGADITIMARKRRDESAKCVERLLDGDHTALPDLLDALEREQDIRFTILNEKLEQCMEAIANSKGDLELTLHLWPRLCLFAVRLMNPRFKEILERATPRRT